jgi:probable poly-beta-1,6-N-acetyl-D-glucosamine export protein
MSANEAVYLVLITTIIFIVPELRRLFVPKPAVVSTTKELEKNTKNRFVVFDVLRGIAILAVVLIHVAELFPVIADSVHTVVLEVLGSSMRFAIPVFFVTSGLLLTPPTHSLKGYILYIQKKVLTIIPAYVLVSLVLALMQNMSPKGFLYALVTGTGAPPFYFVIVLFQLYCIYPFIYTWAEKRWFVYLAFWFSMIFQFTGLLWNFFGCPTMFRFLFFFVWGIYMRKQLIEGKLQKQVSLHIAIVALCMILFGLYHDVFYNIRPFYGLSVLLLLYIFFTSRTHFGLFEKALAWVGSLSLWIFLTHYSLLQFLYPYVSSVESIPVYLLLFLVSVGSLVVSVLFGYLCSVVYTGVVKTVTRHF